MARRTCLIAVANDILPVVLARLPLGVKFYGQQECFERAATIVRLEGPGLPEWCQEPLGGEVFAWATGLIGADGFMHFEPAPSPTGTRIQNLHEYVAKQFGYPN